MVYENGKKVLYVEVLQALYGMLIAAILWYKEFRTSLESIGFEFNPYDPCVANRMVNKLQHNVEGFYFVCYLMYEILLPYMSTGFYVWYVLCKILRGKCTKVI